MINNRQQGNRRRGRNNMPRQNNNNRGGGDSANRIDSRARGNAAQLLEKYKNMARDAQTQGDRVLTEYYLQFADHYFRVLADVRARQEEQQAERRARHEERSQNWREGEGRDDNDSGYAEGVEHGVEGESATAEQLNTKSTDDSDGAFVEESRPPRRAPSRTREPREARAPREQREPRQPRRTPRAAPVSEDHGDEPQGLDASLLPPSIPTTGVSDNDADDTPVVEKRPRRGRKPKAESEEASAAE